MRHIILGTAGHIDHGKSSLVKALTGIDPDRLKEEKERGITIDIGFADLSYPDDGLVVGIVDVPGHERLISNMLAGAGGIDMVMLVIAADEGIMPQSREHLAICNLLAIRAGIIAITKADLVEREWLELMTEEVRSFVRGSFLDDAPVIPVSSRTAENLDLLKNEIRKIALAAEPKKDGGLFRLPIDRVFTLKGFGTVVTGTAVAGTLSIDDPVDVMPAGISSKVRGLHSHGRSIPKAHAGQRVAINLQGVEKEDLSRGDVAVTPGSFQATRAVDASIDLLKDAPGLKSRSLVHFYSGTAETIARVIVFEQDELKGGAKAYCQFRLQEPVVVMAGDRYIIRRFSPLETLGGGEILDPWPGRRRRKEGIADLERLYHGTLEERLGIKISRLGIAGIQRTAVYGWIQEEVKTIDSALIELEKRGEILRFDDLLLHRKAVEMLRTRIAERLAEFHRQNPLKPGMPKEELRTLLNIEGRYFSAILAGIDSVSVDRDIVRMRDFRVALSGADEATKTRIMKLLDDGGFQPPTKQELMEALKLSQKQVTDMLNVLTKEAAIVKISDALYLSAERYRRMLEMMKASFGRKPEMTVAEFRDLIGTSRKYALPMLEHLDASRVTIRIGDVRKLIQKS